MGSRFLHKNVGWFFLIGFLSALIGVAAGGMFALMNDLPQIRALENFRPSAVTRAFSSDGKLIGEFYTEKRVPVSIDKIPQDLIQALITTEDRSFYAHIGIDLKGMLRAAAHDLWAGEFVEGASTITQQLAKTLFLDSRKTIVRKIREAILSLQLERRYTKPEILELYLNQVYFGSGAYGVESAARIFFGKSVSDLSLAECALLAAMPKAPSRFSPLVNLELATKRRNLVLRQMRDTGVISESAYRASAASALLLSDTEKPGHMAPYFLEFIRNFLEREVGAARLYKGGLRVDTTLNARFQQTAEDSMARGLEALDKRMKVHFKEATDTAQGALVAVDIDTGGILAMVGGRNFSQSQFNRVTQARRQPGSAFKPIVYADAIEQGFSQNRTLIDAPVIFRGSQSGEDWQPENFSKTYAGAVTLREALVHSKNIPAVRLIEMIGPSSVVAFAQRLGFRSALSPNLSLALGTSEVTLMELTAAYAVFANRGERIEPYGVIQVTDGSGQIIWTRSPKRTVAMSRQGAAIVTDMLQAVIAEGTGQNARYIHRPLAGKTGTTDDFSDALFIGYSPSIACGVWVGKDIRGPLGPNETGARAALPIWADFMAHVLSDLPYRYFDIPDGVVQVTMDPVSGAFAPADAPGAVRAMFRNGEQPVAPGNGS